MTASKTLLAIVAALALALPAAANPQERHQEARIGEGVASGELTRHEAKRLHHEQKRIDHMQRKAKKDGVVTGREARRIDRQQDQASRHIARQKHDRQER
jgi:hypothetical protein